MNLQQAAELLRNTLPSTHFSSVYRTAPQEVEDQPDFLNAVAKIETDASPEEIQNVLEKIEQDLKKDPPHRFGPRTIDLDLLLYDNLIFPSPEAWKSSELPATSYQLIIPHPKMHFRRFVLEPLCELINPKNTHPVLQKSWGEFLAETVKQKVDLDPCDLQNIEAPIPV